MRDTLIDLGYPRWHGIVRGSMWRRIRNVGFYVA